MPLTNMEDFLKESWRGGVNVVCFAGDGAFTTETRKTDDGRLPFGPEPFDSAYGLEGVERLMVEGLISQAGDCRSCFTTDGNEVHE